MSVIPRSLGARFALFAFGLIACSRSNASPSSAGTTVRTVPLAAPQPEPASAATAFAPPADLTATLRNASDIDLRWRPSTTEPGGYWIEFATPGADFVKLGAVWPETTTFRHAALAAETTFIYRIRPFFGRVSNLATITTGSAPAAAPSEVEGPLEEPGSAPASGGPGPTKSIRSTLTIADAAPGDLATTLRSPTSVDLRWGDHATDEDGYLVEFSQDQRDFKICALLPPNITSFRKAALPPNTKLYFRVRAFFYAEPSKLVSVTTPAEPGLSARDDGR
jgi:hypothetical protein